MTRGRPLTLAAALAAAAALLLALLVFRRQAAEALASAAALRILYLRAARHFGRERRPRSSWAELVQAWSVALLALRRRP